MFCADLDNITDNENTARRSLSHYTVLSFSLSLSVWGDSTSAVWLCTTTDGASRSSRPAFRLSSLTKRRPLSLSLSHSLSLLPNFATHALSLRVVLVVVLVLVPHVAVVVVAAASAVAICCCCCTILSLYFVLFFCIYFWPTVSVTFCFMMSLGAYRYVLLLLLLLLPLLAIGRVSCGVLRLFVLLLTLNANSSQFINTHAHK